MNYDDQNELAAKQEEEWDKLRMENLGMNEEEYSEWLDDINYMLSGTGSVKKESKLKEQPLPEEFALGNLVKLNEPYRMFDHGIIVEHIGYSAMGYPYVSLHLYNTKGEMFLMSGGLRTPCYVDFAATEFEVIRAANTRYKN